MNRTVRFKQGKRMATAVLFLFFSKSNLRDIYCDEDKR